MKQNREKLINQISDVDELVVKVKSLKSILKDLNSDQFNEIETLIEKKKKALV